MNSIPIDDISIDDVNRLYESSEREKHFYDFKRQINWDENGKDKLKKWVVAFANANGGDVIVGVCEEEGVIGVEIENIDAYLTRINNVLYNSVEPIIGNLQLGNIKVDDENKYIVVIRVGKSYLAPHRIKGGEKYWVRRIETDNMQMGIDQIREMFNYSQETRGRLNNFVDSRVSLIKQGNPDVSEAVDKGVMFFASPIGLFAQDKHYDVTSYVVGKGYCLNCWGVSNNHPRMNFDGIINEYVIGSPDLNYGGAYTQIHRNGVFETVSSLIATNGRFRKNIIHGHSFAVNLIKLLKNTVSRYINTIGYFGPVQLNLYLFNLESYDLELPNTFSFNGGLNKPLFRFPSLYVEQDIGANAIRQVKPWLDQLWNAFGHRECFPYRSEHTIVLDGKEYYDEDAE